MTAEARHFRYWAAQPSPYWLPPLGTSNGLSALAWAPIADLSAREAVVMLDVCAQRRIAAFSGPRDGGRPRRRRAVYRVWVDSQRFGAAEDALRHALAEVRAIEARRR